MHYMVGLMLVIAVGMASDAAAAQIAPEFKLGFKALADQIPHVVGQPLENEHWGANGDSLQRTTTGLMVWRKADNWTAFTDGNMTWINGPYGVVRRYNHQRFEWERDTVVVQPSQTPAPSPGLILYESDWSGGLDGWPEGVGWRVTDGMLTFDGSIPNTFLAAPHRPESPDYAVEAEIRVVSPFWQRQAFGLMARERYQGGVNWWSYMRLNHPFLGTASGVLVQTDLNIDDGWHSYRLEVQGNRLKLLIDGQVRAEATDGQYSSPGRAGIWSNGVQINVRNFKIVAL